MNIIIGIIDFIKTIINILYNREFLIMYKKMIFIFIPIYFRERKQQMTIVLLFFTTLFWRLTFIHKPYLSGDINNLELLSNTVIWISVFAGALYVLDINDFFKAILFIIFAIVNTIFNIKWFSFTLQAIIDSYYDKIFKWCPCLIKILPFLKKAKNFANLVSFKSLRKKSTFMNEMNSSSHSDLKPLELKTKIISCVKN